MTSRGLAVVVLLHFGEILTCRLSLRVPPLVREPDCKASADARPALTARAEGARSAQLHVMSVTPPRMMCCDLWQVLLSWDARRYLR
jgi:hypothetical protein